MNGKGFLLTDATGNVIYIPLHSNAAKEIARTISQSAGEYLSTVNSCKTLQRHIINKYISSKTEEDFLGSLGQIKEGGS